MRVIHIIRLPGPNSKFKLPDAKPAGIIAGFWHGFIAWFTLLINTFTKEVKMYETNNIGGGYDFAFLFGGVYAWIGVLHKYAQYMQEFFNTL